MKTLLRTSSLALAAALALALSAQARAEETSSTFKFSDPSKPGTLNIHIGRGEIRVHGADTTDIKVVSDTVAPKREARGDGLRVLASSSSYGFSEKANVATLEYGSVRGGDGDRARFEITVPRTTAVVVSNALGGEVVCSDLSGNVDVKSLNGSVKVENAAGGVMVETMNGSVSASIKELHEGRSVCCTSMNGAVTIRVPGDAKANLRLRTQNGAILTDFDDKSLVTKSELTPGKARRTVHVVINRAGSPDEEETLTEETRTVIHDAARKTAEAAREAAQAMKEAARAAREGAEEGSEEIILPPMPPLPPMTGGKTVPAP